jgi:hypothetical protein
VPNPADEPELEFVTDAAAPPGKVLPALARLLRASAERERDSRPGGGEVRKKQTA